MKSLALSQVTQIDSRLKNLDIEIQNGRIDKLYELGYIWDPYTKDFYNPLIQKGFKPQVVYNLTEENIHDIHDHNQMSALISTKTYRTLDEFKTDLYKTNAGDYLISIIDKVGFLTSLLLIIISAISLFVLNSKALTILSSILLFAISYYWVMKKIIYVISEEPAFETNHFEKNKNTFFLYLTFCFFLCFAFIYLVTNSFIQPTIGLLAIIIFERRAIDRALSKQYWKYKGYFELEKHLNR